MQSTKAPLRIIFIGHEWRILENLLENQKNLNIKVVGVYVYKPKFSLRSVGRWICQFPLYQTSIKKIKLLFPSLNKRYWRHIALYDIAGFAKKHQLPCFKSASINDNKVRNQFNQHNIDIGIVASFAQKLSKDTLKSTEYGFINFHPGQLPKYRGAKPIDAAFANQENEIHVCWHMMTDRIDAGEVIACQRFERNNMSIAKALDTAVDIAKELLPNALSVVKKQAHRNT